MQNLFKYNLPQSKDLSQGGSGLSKKIIFLTTFGIISRSNRTTRLSLIFRMSEATIVTLYPFQWFMGKMFFWFSQDNCMNLKTSEKEIMGRVNSEKPSFFLEIFFGMKIHRQIRKLRWFWWCKNFDRIPREFDFGKFSKNSNCVGCKNMRGRYFI